VFNVMLIVKSWSGTMDFCLDLVSDRALLPFFDALEVGDGSDGDEHRCLLQ
jgi:hypothetical protein